MHHVIVCENERYRLFVCMFHENLLHYQHRISIFMNVQLKCAYKEWTHHTCSLFWAFIFFDANSFILNVYTSLSPVIRFPLLFSCLILCSVFIIVLERPRNCLLYILVSVLFLNRFITEFDCHVVRLIFRATYGLDH